MRSWPSNRAMSLCRSSLSSVAAANTREQVSCHITHTTEETHDIIRGALSESPMYSGLIEGVGPRYCPSIEDKVVRSRKDPRTRFLLNRRVCIHTRCIPTEFRPACRMQRSCDLFARSQDSKKLTLLNQVMRSSMTTLIHAIYAQHSRHALCPGFILRGR